jgi:hypothetical protein
MNFDEDVDSFDDYLADDWPELSDPKHRFKERVNQLMRQKNRTRTHAEEVITEVILTKCCGKFCKCGEVAQFVVGRAIYCYDCHPEKDKL